MSESMLLDKLVVERCLHNLAHLRAVIHHTGLEGDDLSEKGAQSVHNLIDAISNDLRTLDYTITSNVDYFSRKA